MLKPASINTLFNNIKSVAATHPSLKTFAEEKADVFATAWRSRLQSLLFENVL